ncbi:MAG: hypothetical protein K0R98_90 [Rickettsiaceae bacterium]|nr:hypothetical protein [Rickettsiaceae bacterium]
MCIFLGFVLTGFTDKDEVYYQSHLGEAVSLLNGRCKSVGDDFFTKDSECVSARFTVQRDIEVKERNALIESLHKKREKLDKLVKIDDLNKQRYALFKSDFSNDIEKTGDFIIECFKSDKRVVQNGVECLASVDSMIQTLEKKRDEEIVKNDKEIKYKEHYQRYFREDASRIDQVLEGRCKELFANPWYSYDPELQDKECNIAVEEKRRNKRLNSVTRIQKKQEDKRDLEYFKKRISEAFMMQKDCDSGSEKNKENCSNAKEAIQQFEENKNKAAEFRKIYQRDIQAAKKTAESCRAGDNTDNVKCLAATAIINEDVRKVKERQELNRYLLYYRGNLEEAKKLLVTKCNVHKEESSQFVKDSECIAIKRIVNEDVAFRERDKLIAQLESIKANLSKSVDLQKKENIQRFNSFKESFALDNESAEDFVASCINDKERASNNSVECFASTESVLETIKKLREDGVAKLEKEAQFRDSYQKRLRYLKEHEEEAEAILNGRCKAIFSDPWYDYDVDIQDSECNAALEARRSIRRAELLSRSGLGSGKDLSYFRSNIKEAAQVQEACSKDSDIDKKSCDAAGQAIEEDNRKKQKQVEYRRYYSEHLDESSEVVKQCQALVEKDDDKCDVVLEIESREVTSKQNKEKLKRFVAFYRSNVKKASEFIAKSCNDLSNVDEVVQLECKAAAEVAKESAAAKINNALLEDLHKLKEKLISTISAEDANKSRYEKLRDNFRSDINGAQEFALLCAKDNVRLKRSKIECLASVNSLVEYLEVNNENAAKESEKQKSYKESRKSYFRSNSAEADKLLEGRCKPILADPWYRYDKDLQDEECNAAFSEKRRRDEMKQLASIIGNEDAKKDLTYYRKNLAEAKVFSEECANKEKTAECEYAVRVLNEKKEEETKKKEYKEYFSSNAIEAKKVVDECNEEKEQDKLKCSIANEVYSKNIRSDRDKKEFARYVNYYKANIEEARAIEQGKCKNYIGLADSIFIEDLECSAVFEAIKITEALNGRDELISRLSLIKRKIAPNFGNTKNKKYKSYLEFFKNNPEEVEKFIASCAGNGVRAKQNNLECVAAIDFLKDKLELQKKDEADKLLVEQKYKEYYRKKFKENPKVVDDLLSGHCKILFADPWYGYDSDTQDRECDAARAERNAESRIAENIKLSSEKKEVKNIDYYRKNADKAKALAEECADGVVTSLSDCEMALRVDREVTSKTKKQTEYTEFYKGHPLAAQFHLRWCKSAMLNFDTECQVVDEILKNHKNRVDDPELVKKYTELFQKNPHAALDALKGVCAEKIKDSWYFLDVNLQTEECNAALEVIK